FTDISARIYRPWEMYNAMLHALDYGVTGQVLFGSDFPVQTTEEALKTFRALRTNAPGLPPIPEQIVESIINDRPLELIWSLERIARGTDHDDGPVDTRSAAFRSSSTVPRRHSPALSSARDRALRQLCRVGGGDRCGQAGNRAEQQVRDRSLSWARARR